MSTDEQQHQNDTADVTDSTAVDYTSHLESIVADLDGVIHSLGNDLSVAVVSDVQSERVAGVSLRLALDALQSARDVVASVNPSGAPVGVKAGV